MIQNDGENGEARREVIPLGDRHSTTCQLPTQTTQKSYAVKRRVYASQRLESMPLG